MQRSKRTVVVVDDDASIREMVIEFLASQGISAIGAAGAEEALALVERGGIDLVLSDYHLPERDGIALIEAIAARSDRGHVRCVLMSGDASAQDALHAIGGGGSVVFLRKPFALATLGVIVRRLSGRRASGALPRVA